MRPLNPANKATPRLLQALSRFLAAARPGTVVGLAMLLISCATERPGPRTGAADAHTLSERSFPGSVSDRPGGTDDIQAGFTSQQIEPTQQNICAVVAVIEQESNFHVNPIIPGLPAIAWKEIHARAEHSGVPWMLVHGALALKSPTGRTYGERIDQARTEKDLSDIYEDFIGSVP